MALDITDERVRAAGARLHDGGWWYSPRQLYYAVCADVETQPTRIASGEVGLGVILILVGAITGQRIALAVLGLIGLAILIVGLVTHVQERRPLPQARLLAISFPEFERRFLAPGHDLPGLTTGTAEPPPAGATALVVCDRAETAAVLAANRDRIGDVAVATAEQLADGGQGRRVIVLHDCDPAGCALTADLRDGGADAVDAGINPRELTGRRLQLLEGAPARLKRDLTGHLDPAESDWLLSGRRLECATESPEQLVQRVQAALAGSTRG